MFSRKFSIWENWKTRLHPWCKIREVQALMKSQSWSLEVKTTNLYDNCWLKAKYKIIHLSLIVYIVNKKLKFDRNCNVLLCLDTAKVGTAFTIDSPTQLETVGLGTQHWTYPKGSWTGSPAVPVHLYAPLEAWQLQPRNGKSF